MMVQRMQSHNALLTLVNLVVCKQPKLVLQGCFGPISKILKLGCTGSAVTFALLSFNVLFHMTKIHIMEQR
jgi:hypothetical protein